MELKEGSVLIIGGGTGGHISPGIALYEEFMSRGVKAVFLASNRDKKYTSLEAVDSELLNFYPAPPFTANPVKLPIFALRFFLAAGRASRIMKRNHVRAVIGMGGYTSAPALFAAGMRGIPIFLCEQNSIPGKVTRLFEKKARKIFGTFEVSARYLKNRDAFVCTGNPVRNNAICSVPRDEARRAFNLGHCRKVLLVIGGSQGAMRLNNLIFSLRERYPSDFKDIGIIWSTGPASFSDFKKKVQEELSGGSIYLSPYIEKVGLAYRASNLAISRSGAGVMMELAGNGLPSILIPYPYAADNHQALNAAAFEEAGASLSVADSQATAENVAPMLFQLLSDDRGLAAMSEASVKAARTNAASEIAVRVSEAVGL